MGFLAIVAIGVLIYLGTCFAGRGGTGGETRAAITPVESGAQVGS